MLYALIVVASIGNCAIAGSPSNVCEDTVATVIQHPVRLFQTEKACEAERGAPGTGVVMFAQCVPVRMPGAQLASWHVLVQTEDGTVSLISGLTKKDAERVRDQLLDYSEPCTPPKGSSVCMGAPHMIQPGDVKSVKVFQ